MTDLLIKNTTIVTMNPDFENNIIAGNIHIKDGIIYSITEEKQNPNQNGNLKPAGLPENTKVIDGTDLIIMPGLINTHGHAAMSMLRSYADDLPLMTWLEEKILPAESRMEPEDIYWGTMLSIAEMIRGGTTTFTDMYIHTNRVAGAVEETGIRAVLSRGMVGIDNQKQNRIDEANALIKNWHKGAEGRITVMLGPHALYTCPPDYLRKVINLAEKNELPIQIHVAETRFEVENCLEIYNSTPVEILNDLGLFEHNAICAHCVHVSEKDIGIIAQEGASISHNPGSNLKLGSGIAPLEKFLEAGIKTGLGTDGASSNNNLDMFEEMRLAALLPKGAKEDPTLVPAREVLKMATSTGAEALFLPDTGIIKEGCRADIIGISKNLSHLSPLHDIEAHLVYSASGADVELVIVDGQVLMEKRNLLTIDVEKVIYEAGKRASRLTEK